MEKVLFGFTYIFINGSPINFEIIDSPGGLYPVQ